MPKAAPVICAAILARSSSPERPGGLLPDRALTPIGGLPALAHLLRRLNLCRRLDHLVLAAGEAQADRRILKAAEDLELPWVAGHPHNLLKRLLMAAESRGADHVVRVNGNFPLLDPWALTELIVTHLEQKADYSSNAHYQGLVYGLGAEVISTEILREQVHYGQPGDQYSGTRLFLRRPGDFKINLRPAARRALHYKAAIDFGGDGQVVEAILARYPEPDNEMVIEFFETHPDLIIRGHSGPDEVSLSKVLLFPEKLSSLKKNSLDSADPSYPISVELSLTNRCNQNCLWCSDRNLRERSPDRLEFDHLKRLFDDLAAGGARGVTIEGGGEPTLAEFFDQAAQAALDRGLAVGLITNGLELFPPRRDPALYRLFEWIRISLDAADRWQYLQIKGVDGFDQVLGNLIQLAAEAPDATLGVGYVLTNRNDDPDQLQHLTLTMRSLGVNYLQIRPVVDHPEMISSCLPLDFLKKFETPDFSVNLSALSQNEPLGNAGLPCLAHSLSSVIGADGVVWLCGRLNTKSSARPIGDLSNQSFREIWHGPERARQTAQAASAKFCQIHCPQCRMVKYNQLMAEIDRLKTKNFI